MKTKLFATFGIATSLLLSACAAQNHQTPAQTRNAMLGGAAMGAAIGALSQADGGDRHDIGKGAAVGAAVGAAAGYATTR